MPINCIIPSQAEKLKKAFKDGDISFVKLYNLGSSQARIDLLSKYIGESAKLLNTKIEKVFISPNQKLAARNFIYQEMGEGKPLYKEVGIEQAKKIRDNLNIRDLRKMKPEDRIKSLSKYVGEESAIKLNDRFIKLKKTGNLSNWEARTFGTDILKQYKKLKGELSKLEALDDLGVLSPAQLEQFMGSFVESKMGISLSVDEGQKLSKLINEQKDIFDEIMKTNDWTYTNEKNVTDYLVKVKEVEKYIDSLKPKRTADIFNNIFDYFRASILASPRILKNSFLYQIIPATERTIAKRLVSSNFSDGDLESNLVEKIQSKLSGVKPSLESTKFIKKQTAMSFRIYAKTGYDISRMQTLNDGNTFFGEKIGNITGKDIFSRVGRFVNLAPKWLAGSTDVLFAFSGRADTSIMMSKEIAKLEFMKGKLPKGLTMEERATQLLKDSYSFTPKDPQAQKIRTMAILDANMMNNTQPNGTADWVVKFRDSLKLGKLNFGKVIIPFAKIATTSISEGLKTTSGYGVIKGIVQINNATKFKGIERSIKMQQGVGNIIRYLGLMGATILFASLLDDDDYIGYYESLGSKEYKLARARGASTSYVKIGGVWVSMNALSIINIPLSSIMLARQAKSKGGNILAGYVSGMASALLSTPGIQESREIIDKMVSSAKSKTNEEIINSTDLNGKDIISWAKVRVIPSVLSYDLYNAVFKPDSKYDFLGREIEKGNWFYKEDKTNKVINEFIKLYKYGQMPTVSDPTGEYAVELEEKLGEEKYIRELSKLQKNYSKEVLDTIKQLYYKKLTPEEKKKEIDAIRQEYILDELKSLNEDSKY